MAEGAMRVLLVEVNPGETGPVREISQADNSCFMVERAASVNEVLHALAGKEDRAEIILLDLGPPQEKGLQALQQIARAADGTPLIVLTGLRGGESANSALQDSCQGAQRKKQRGEDRLGTVIRCAMERRQLAGQAQSALREQEDLMREVQHRVKNNLQVIQSLLKMQARSLQEGETRAAIGTMAQRVHAMALVHERIYQNQHPSHRSLANYLLDLFHGALESNALEPDRIRLHLEVEEIPLSLEHAIPFGLLANELICNSLQHGFKGDRRGAIGISIRRINDAVHFELRDDGAGLPKDFDPTSLPSLGLKLAAQLARQLGGELEFLSQKGCVVRAKLTRL